MNSQVEDFDVCVLIRCGQCGNLSPICRGHGRNGTLKRVMLFLGNGDYSRLVTALQRRGRQVDVVSTLQSDSPVVSDELRRQTDNFVDLDDLREHTQRERG